MKQNSKIWIYLFVILGFISILQISCTKDKTDPETNEIPNSFTDSRDGQVYKTVEIGTQTWFAENLNYETTNSWWYDNSSTKGDIYGRLYSWADALTACPSGWHLPSDIEWKQLEMHLGMSQSEADAINDRGTDEGKILKSTSGWNTNDGNGTDAVGFSALPGGYFSEIDSHFNGLLYVGCWWQATAYSSTSAWYRAFNNSSTIHRYYSPKSTGYSIRCIKD